jgi:hypothetical protein
MLSIVEELALGTDTDCEYLRQKDKIMMSNSDRMTSLLEWDLRTLITECDRMGNLLEPFVFHQVFAQSHVQKAFLESITVPIVNNGKLVLCSNSLKEPPRN